MTVDLADRVLRIIERHPAVTAAAHVGSRARGDATPLSDWDFEIETDDFPAVAADLPEITRTLDPSTSGTGRCGSLRRSRPTRTNSSNRSS